MSSTSEFVRTRLGNIVVMLHDSLATIELPTQPTEEELRTPRKQVRRLCSLCTACPRKVPPVFRLTGDLRVHRRRQCTPLGFPRRRTDDQVRWDEVFWLRTYERQRDDACAEPCVLDRDPSVGCHIGTNTPSTLYASSSSTSPSTSDFS